MDMEFVAYLAAAAAFAAFIGALIGYSVCERRKEEEILGVTKLLSKLHSEQEALLQKVIRDHEQTVADNSVEAAKNLLLAEQASKYWKEQHDQLTQRYTFVCDEAQSMSDQLAELHNELADISSDHNKRMITRGKRAMGKLLRAKHDKTVATLEADIKFNKGLAERANTRLHCFGVAVSQTITEKMKLLPVRLSFNKALNEKYDNNLKQVKMQ